MNTPVEFQLNIIPEPWRRVDRGKYGQAYANPQTVAYEIFIARAIKSVWKHKPLLGPLFVTLTFSMPRPKSWRLERYHCKRPDLDNLEKSMCDALNGVLWKDDGQIAKVHKQKIYDQEPYIKIRVEELPG